MMSQVLYSSGLNLEQRGQKYDFNKKEIFENNRSYLNNYVKGFADNGGAFVIFGTIC